MVLICPAGFVMRPLCYCLIKTVQTTHLFVANDPHSADKDYLDNN